MTDHVIQLQKQEKQSEFMVHNELHQHLRDIVQSVTKFLQKNNHFDNLFVNDVLLLEGVGLVLVEKIDKVILFVVDDIHDVVVVVEGAVDVDVGNPFVVQDLFSLHPSIRINDKQLLQEILTLLTYEPRQDKLPFTNRLIQIL